MNKQGPGKREWTWNCWFERYDTGDRHVGINVSKIRDVFPDKRGGPYIHYGNWYAHGWIGLWRWMFVVNVWRDWRRVKRVRASQGGERGA